MMICVRHSVMMVVAMLVIVLHAPDALAQDIDVVGTFESVKTDIERQIKEIADAPAKPGESLKDEFSRKKKETKALRQRLKQLEEDIARIKKEQAEKAKAEKDKKSGTEQSKISTAGDKYDAAIKRINAQRKALKRPRKVTTKCKPCEPLAKQATQLDAQRFRLEISLLRAEEEYAYQTYEVDQQVEDFKNSGRKPSGGMDMATYVLGLYVEVDNKFRVLREKIQKQIKQVEKRMAETLVTLAACEKQCSITEDRSEIIGSLPGSKTAKAIPLPFKWNGPYKTDCPACVRIVAQLNSLPTLARERMAKIVELEADLAKSDLDDDIEEYDDDNNFGNYGKHLQREEYRRKIEAKIDKLKNEINNIAKHVPIAEAALTKCEKDECKIEKSEKVGCVLPGESQIFVPAGGIGTGVNADGTVLCSVEVELEYTVSTFGTNGFDANEIERIPEMVNDTEITGGTFTPPVTVDPTTPTTPTTPVTPVTPVTPTTPLVVTASGAVTFAHIVGTSPCPQSAGTIMIMSNNGNPLTVSGVATSGTLMTRLNNTVNGSGSANPSITSQFNCSSADNGSFNGAVTGTATDTVTGETSTFSVPASGTVTGP